ncbi:MAG: hypothetical protein HY042_06620, partial [Spirochaetia bacterium]|nr:hypothetical protein [Spirochaetia bacterium]
LQVPYFVFSLNSPPAASTGVTESLIGLVHNVAILHPLAAYRYLVQGSSFLILDNADIVVRHSFVFVVLPWAAALIQARREPGWLFLSLLPIGLAWIGYTVSQIGYDLYFQVTLIVPFSLSLCLGIEALSAKWRVPMFALLAIILFWQPARFAKSPLDRMPEYGTLVKGAKAIAASGKAFRNVIAPSADKRTNPLFLLECLGKKPDAGGQIAVIDSQGNVEWRR